MTCRELTDFLYDYLDGNLAPAERARFEAHLGECPDCVTYLRSYRETVRLGKAVCQADHDAIDDEVPEELVEAILAARKRGA